MMRFFFILLLISTNHIAHSKGMDIIPEDSLLLRVMEQLDLEESDINSELYVGQALPYSESGTVMVILKYVKEDDERFIDHRLEADAYVVVVDNEDGKILSKYDCPKVVGDDLPLLYRIEIEDKDYQLNKNIRAFGIRFYYTMHSRINPYYVTKLSLFVYENNLLKRILCEYPVSEYMGEVYDQDVCMSWYLSLDSDIMTDENEKDEFRDLIIEEVLTHGYDCDEKKIFDNQRLIYNGKEYGFKEKNLYQLLLDLE